MSIVKDTNSLYGKMYKGLLTDSGNVNVSKQTVMWGNNYHVFKRFKYESVSV
jgi:hypothetical protein